MPRPLTPSSSQEVVPISPPPGIYSSISKSIVTTKSNPARHTRPQTAPSQSRNPSQDVKPRVASTLLKPKNEIITCDTTMTMAKYADSSFASTSSAASTLTSTTLPKPRTFRLASDLRNKILIHVRKDKYLQQIGEVPTPGDPVVKVDEKDGGEAEASGESRERDETEDSKDRKDRTETKSSVSLGKRKARAEEVEKERKRLEEGGMSRERVTERMMSTLGKGSNPITNSDLYSRTDHFVSCSTGHQQSNAGGGSAGAGTYWEVRTAKMVEQAREKKTEVLTGCVFYINGSTGPRVSNLQLQNIITSNGGRFVPMQSSSCTHIIANNLSGSKTQKWIDGQAGRGCAKRMKIVKVDWVLDSVEKGRRLSEMGYGVIENPSQMNLFKAFGVKSKADKERELKNGEGTESSPVVNAQEKDGESEEEREEDVVTVL